MAVDKNCKGFACGSNLINGSVTADKFDKESFVELFREVMKEQSKESWMKEIFENVLKDSIDDSWMRDFFQDLINKYIGEEWFKDAICSLGCTVPAVLFEVIPTDLTFKKEGETKSIDIVVADDAEWELTV